MKCILSLLLVLSTLCSFTSAYGNANTWGSNTAFFIQLQGSGYNATIENEAWNTVMTVFQNYFGTYQSFQPGQPISYPNRRALASADEEPKNLRGAESQEQGHRELFNTCPKSCSTNWTKLCRALCTTSSGRRRLNEEEEKGNRELYFTYKFNMDRCNAAINNALKQYTSMAGVQMYASVSNLN